MLEPQPSREVANRIQAGLPGVQVRGRVGRQVTRLVSNGAVDILGFQIAARVQEEKVVADARVTEAAMHETARLARKAKELAGDDPWVASLLGPQVISYAENAARVNRSVIGW